MTTVHAHNCRPLHVAGVLRATCQEHFWQPIVPVPTSAAGAR